MRWTLRVVVVAAFLAGCASASSQPARPAEPFDPQTLVGRWRGEWRTLRHTGPAILDLTAVRGREAVGRLNLVGYVVQYEGRTGREIEIAGTVTERGGAVTLALTSALPPLTLRVSGSRMDGRAAAGVADLLTTLTLEKVR